MAHSLFLFSSQACDARLDYAAFCPVKTLFLHSAAPIPSHIGIRGKDKADTAAKAALSLSITPMKLTASEFLPRVNKLISEDVVIINRLRIGHTRLTHSYLLASGDQPECVTF